MLDKIFFTLISVFPMLLCPMTYQINFFHVIIMVINIINVHSVLIKEGEYFLLWTMKFLLPCLKMCKISNVNLWHQRFNKYDTKGCIKIYGLLFFLLSQNSVNSTCKWRHANQLKYFHVHTYLWLLSSLIFLFFLSLSSFSRFLSFFPSSHPLVLSLSPFLVSSIPSCSSF